MKKVMIFYGSYGGGHLSAARAINEYIKNNFNDIETSMVDCIEYVNKFVNKITTKAYSDMAKRVPWAWGYVYKKSEKGIIAKFSNDSNKLMAYKLYKLIEEFSPDYVISTHPFSSQMCAYLKKKGKCNFKLATITTDYAAHDQWLLYHEQVNYFFVAHDGMKQALANKGIDENKIYVTGIPLSNRFLQHYDKKTILNEFGLQENKKTVLFFGGGKMGLGKTKTLEILETLAKDFPDLQIVAISGKNKEMNKHFNEIVEQCARRDSIKVLEYTNKVPELMSISDLVITKPGGLTTTESLASGLPIIAINPIPGQEEENAEFLESHSVAIWLKKNDNIKDKLQDLFSNQNKLKEMKINARLLAKKNSTRDICEILLDK